MPKVSFNQDIASEKEKKIKSIERRLSKIMSDVKDLGYTSYLTPNRWHIMNGDTHSGSRTEAQDQNVVASFYISNVDAGDW